MVLKSITTLERRPWTFVFAPTLAWVEVPKKATCPQVQVCRLTKSRKASHCLELSLLKIHHSVHLVGGSPCPLKLVSLCKFVSLRAELQHFLLHNPFIQILLCPFSKPSYSLRKQPFCFRMICLPNPLPYRVRKLFGLSTSVSNREPAVQKTQNHRNPLKQGLDRILRCTPTITICRQRRERRSNRFQFGSKFTVSFGQFLLRYTKRQRSSEHTSIGSCRCDITLDSMKTNVFFVNGQVFRQGLFCLDRASNDVVSAQSNKVSIPKHIIVPKAVGQSVKRNTPFPEIKSLLQLIVKPRHVRHHEGGTDLVGLSIGQQADFSLGDAKLFGFDDTTKMKTLIKIKGKEFGVQSIHMKELFSKGVCVRYHREIGLLGCKRDHDRFCLSLRWFHRRPPLFRKERFL